MMAGMRPRLMSRETGADEPAVGLMSSVRLMSVMNGRAAWRSVAAGAKFFGK